MNEEKPSTQFWIGNGIMAVALLMLLYMGHLWQVMGAGAMVLWIMLVIAGVIMLMKDKQGPPTSSS